MFRDIIMLCSRDESGAQMNLEKQIVHLETQINIQKLQNGTGDRAEETTRFKLPLLMSVSKPASQRRMLKK